MWKSVAAVCVGGTIGCLLRWFLNILFNSQPSAVPLGTLAANLIGGYIVGVAVAFFAMNSNLAPEWRLLVITGFCGGPSTATGRPRRVIVIASWSFSSASRYEAGSALNSVTVTARALMTQS